jgi:hypothetical protein
MTDQATMPDAATAPIADIMAARSSGAINSIVWSDNYAKVVENRLRADSGMSAVAIPERINMQSIPTAADDVNPAEQAAAAPIDPLTAAYAPAKSPGDYVIPGSHYPSAGEVAGATAIRHALHAAELPVITANAVTSAFDATSRQFEHAEPAQLQAFGDREGQALRELWGPQFADRIKLVDTYLDQLGDKIPFIAHLLADPRARFYFADRQVVNALSQMIEVRASSIR